MGPCTRALHLESALSFTSLFWSSSFVRFPGRFGKLRGSVGIWEVHPYANFPLYPSSPLACTVAT